MAASSDTICPECERAREKGLNTTENLIIKHKKYIECFENRLSLKDSLEYLKFKESFTNESNDKDTELKNLEVILDYLRDQIYLSKFKY